MGRTKDSPVPRFSGATFVEAKVKRIREVRGRLAMLVTGLAVVAIVLAAWTGGVIAVARDWPLASRVQILYAGASLLIVFLVLMFGVGSWSRYVPDDADVAPLPPKPDGQTKPVETKQSIGPSGASQADTSTQQNDAAPNEPADPMALNRDVTVPGPVELKKPPGPA
jgi:hypothetical protein